MDDLQALEAANSEFYAAIEAADLDRMSAVWADGPYTASVTCVHPGWPMLRGRGEVLRSWALIMANTPYIQFVLTGVKAEVHGDQAVVTCEENILTAEGESGTGIVAGGSIVTTNIFVRDGGRAGPEGPPGTVSRGGWRLWLHHGSPVLNHLEDEDEA